MNIDTLNEYIFSKHYITPGKQTDQIHDVARDHLGLHSARIMTPYTTLCSRLTDYTPEMLTSQLYEKKQLIKMRCMRTTLHMVPHDIASMLHMATLTLRTADCLLFFRKNSVSLEYVNNFRADVIDYLDKPRKAADIENIFTKRIKIADDIKNACAKKMLKYFWETGDLCYVNVANNWDKEDRRYALTKQYYGDLELDKYCENTAQEMLVYAYMQNFGPATIKDFAWWSGLSSKLIRDYINNHKNLVTKIHVEGYDNEFYILSEEYERLATYSSVECDWVTLLAYEDPSLKGYYESRFRYVDDQYYNLLFNQIGEVRAGVMHNGKAIGVWTWDKSDKKINIEYFSSPNNSTVRKVNDLKERFEYMLYPNQQLTLFNL